MKRELLFRTDLCNAVQGAWGIKAYSQKNHGNEVQMGLVDTEFICGGDYCFAELKAINELPIHGQAYNWGEEPTAMQLRTLDRIEKAGGNARVLLYVHPQRKVIPVSASSILRVRGGYNIVKRAPPNMRWTTEDLAEFSGIPWYGARTGALELAALLFGPTYAADLVRLSTSPL